MKKLVGGIIDFHENVRPKVRDTFAKLALGQSPDCLMVACSDSRVAPNVFASTDPGDLFVVRNVGNLVPPCLHGGVPADASVTAAIEFAVLELGVCDVVVCGHSSCGAMRGAIGGLPKPGAVHLEHWLAHVRPSVARLARQPAFAPGLPEHDRLSQISVLQQLEHLATYPLVRDRLRQDAIRLHAWWFDIAAAEVLAYDEASGTFQAIGG